MATAEFLTEFNIFFKVIIRIFVPSFGLFPDIAYVRHRIFVKLKKKEDYKLKSLFNDIFVISILNNCSVIIPRTFS